MKARCSNLVVATWVCTKDPLTVEYVRGALHPSLTKQLYGAPSKELIDRAAKSIVWAKYPDLSVEEDPIADQPEDANVLMESNQPFDDNVMAFIGIMTIIVVKAIVLPRCHSSGLVFIGLGALRSPFSQIWRKISAQVELRGIDDGLGSDGSDLSTHFLKSPEGWPQDD
ncbi:hypothetical protein B296_00001206 [Ensete ventricosum]|uniref:Uncharacterized protein n=1 Tax=Ensete ventricosum TaxID=4639 RepID=A0A427AUY4_ENSVE|nr:hypothetical protein B296_00001206 [Ensete ventricosum]